MRAVNWFISTTRFPKPAKFLPNPEEVTFGILLKYAFAKGTIRSAGIWSFGNGLPEMRLREVKEVPRVQHLVAKKFVNHAMKSIRARACGDVDLSPAVAAKLG